MTVQECKEFIIAQLLTSEFLFDYEKFKVHFEAIERVEGHEVMEKFMVNQFRKHAENLLAENCVRYLREHDKTITPGT